MDDKVVVTLDPESAALVDNLPLEITPMRKAPREAHGQPTKPQTRYYLNRRTFDGLKPRKPKPVVTKADQDSLDAAATKRVARQLRRIANASR